MDARPRRDAGRGAVSAISLIGLALVVGPYLPGGQAAAQFAFTNLTKTPDPKLELQPGDRLEGAPTISGGTVAVRVDPDPLGTNDPASFDVVITTGGLRKNVAENSPASLHLGSVALLEKGNIPPPPPGKGETLVLVDTGGLSFPKLVALEVEAEAGDPNANPRDFERIQITDASLSSGNVAFVAGDRVTSGISAARDGIYLGSPAEVRKIAERGDRIPGSPRVFNVFSEPAADGDTVAFKAAILNCEFSAGVFKGRDLQSLSMIALASTRPSCPGTEIPGRPGQTFGALGSPVISEECVAIGGGANSINEGIYLFCDGSSPQLVVHTETLVPEGGGAKFTFLASSSVSIHGRRVAFLGGVPGLTGIYLYEGGSLTKVLDTTNHPSNQILDGKLPAGLVMGHRALEGRTIAFAAYLNSPGAAVYLAKPATPFVEPVDLAAAVLPTSRSAMVGQQAGVFATIINNTPDAVAGCTIRLVTAIPADLTFVTTDPSTNAINGQPNVPVNIPGQSSQSFAVILTATGSFDVTQLIFEYSCQGVGRGQQIVGVNTLSFSASDVPIADFVAIAIEPSRTGLVTVPAPAGATLLGPQARTLVAAAVEPGGTAVLAVAVSNVGAASAATVRADTGSANLPLALFVCETNPASGACLQPPADEVQTFIGAGATPTFGVFVQGQVVDGIQQTVPFDPARHRVFVRMFDAGGAIRGESSVAVRTEN